MMKLSIIILLSMVIFSTYAQPSITGNITDLFNKPIQGVSITIQGSGFKAVSSTDGSYKINFVPGKIVLIYSKAGYQSTSLTLDISVAMDYPATTISLVGIPTSNGVFAVTSSGYRLLNTGHTEIAGTMFAPKFSLTGNFQPISYSDTLLFLINDIHTYTLFQIPSDGAYYFCNGPAISDCQGYYVTKNVSSTDLGQLKLIYLYHASLGNYGFIANEKTTQGWAYHDPCYLFSVSSNYPGNSLNSDNSSNSSGKTSSSSSNSAIKNFACNNNPNKELYRIQMISYDLTSDSKVKNHYDQSLFTSHLLNGVQQTMKRFSPIDTTSTYSKEMVMKTIFLVSLSSTTTSSSTTFDALIKMRCTLSDKSGNKIGDETYEMKSGASLNYLPSYSPDDALKKASNKVSGNLGYFIYKYLPIKTSAVAIVDTSKSGKLQSIRISIGTDEGITQGLRFRFDDIKIQNPSSDPDYFAMEVESVEAHSSVCKISDRQMEIKDILKMGGVIGIISIVKQ